MELFFSVPSDVERRRAVEVDVCDRLHGQRLSSSLSVESQTIEDHRHGSRAGRFDFYRRIKL